MLRWLVVRRALVKQIRNGDLVGTLIERGDSYFHWLQEQSGVTGPLSSMLADTEFVSLYGLDDILMEKAKEDVRQMYAESVLKGDEYNDKNVETVCKSIRGNCCLFEVIFCLADSINDMFDILEEDAENGTKRFFGILLENAGFTVYDEEDWDMHEDKVKTYWQECINRILTRSYDDTGLNGGLFPLEWVEDYRDDRVSYTDQRGVSLWQQMNDWVDEHTNEDGEWVD